MRIIDVNDECYEWSEFTLKNVRWQDYVAFDLEATGLDFNAERITQFGAVAIDNGKIKKSMTFNKLVNPLKTIPEEVERLTGISNEKVKSAPVFNLVFSEFLRFSKSRIWVTQSGYEFDCPLIIQECKRNKINFPRFTVIDTKALFTYLHPELEGLFNIDFLMDYYKIDNSKFKRHDALGDAMMVAQIFCSELAEVVELGIKDIKVNKPIRIKKSSPGKLPKLVWTR